MRKTRIGKLLESEDIELYEMSNLRQSRTGLPMVIWIQFKGKAKHGPRVKVSTDYATKIGDDSKMVSVSITDDPKVVAGTGLRDKDLKAVTKFILLNKETLLQHWNEEIDSAEIIQKLKKVSL